LSKYCDFQKKKFLGNLVTLVHFISQKSFVWVAMEFFFFPFFGVTKRQKFGPPKKKNLTRCNLNLCYYIAKNSYQLDQISHACNFITPWSDLSFLPTYDSHDRRSHSHKAIYIYTLTLIICSSLKSTLVVFMSSLTCDKGNFFKNKKFNDKGFIINGW
jgi:hypothetical protein